MLPKLLISVGIFFYALVVPLLEINHTHVFNPEWVAHARLHEVWQLTTNTALGIYALWLAWAKNDIARSGMLTFFITGGFLFSWVTRDAYGGSMVLSDGSEKIFLGINSGVFVFTLSIALTLLAMRLARMRPPAP